MFFKRIIPYGVLNIAKRFEVNEMKLDMKKGKKCLDIGCIYLFIIRHNTQATFHNLMFFFTDC